VNVGAIIDSAWRAMNIRCLTRPGPSPNLVLLSTSRVLDTSPIACPGLGGSHLVHISIGHSTIINKSHTMYIGSIDAVFFFFSTSVSLACK
jgi:hypothetical protein